MNNLLSYCGLIDARMRASEKDLPVNNTNTSEKVVFYLIYKKHVCGLLTRNKPSQNQIQQPIGTKGRVSDGLDPRL